MVFCSLIWWAAFEVVAASSVGYGAGALVNYVINYTFTFESNKAHSSALPKFFVVAGFGFALNAGLVALFARLLEFHYLLAQVLATVIILLWNFVLNRIWTFAREANEYN